MIMVYGDTNFLTALICRGPHAEEALRLEEQARTQGTLPLPVTFLGRLEVTNSIEQQVFLTHCGVFGIRVTTEGAMINEATFLDELQRGEIMRAVSVPEAELESLFAALAHHHTAKERFRTYDIVHVASAILLGCDTFWSFDVKARNWRRWKG